MKKQRKTSKRRKRDPMRLICWLIIPAVTVCVLVADAIGLYPITKESLIVIGLCLAAVLLPFFGEIKVKDLSVKRSSSGSKKDT